MKPDITQLASFLLLGLFMAGLFWKELMSPEVIHTLLGLLAGLLLRRGRSDERGGSVAKDAL